MQIWIFTILLAAYFFLHSFLALDRVKAVLTQYLLPTAYYRLGYNTFAVLSLGPVVWAYLQCPSKEILEYHPIVHWLGAGLVLAGLMGNYMAIKQYDVREFLGLSPAHEKAEWKGMLVTKGWNAYVRHPLYLAAFLIVAGVFVYAPSYLHLAIVLVVTAYLFIGIMLEEQKLIRQYGQEYVNYQKEVPMLFPRLWPKRRN
jgi:protein-S-isoprenylcysteine O-methyltransferase Ste14